MYGLSGPDWRRHGELRRPCLRSRLPERQQTVQWRVHLEHGRLQRGMRGRNAQLLGRLSARYEHQLLRRRMQFLSRADIERLCRMQRDHRDLQYHLRHRIRELPEDEPVRAHERRVLRQFRLYLRGHQYRRRLWNREHLQLSLRKRVQDVWNGLHRQFELLHRHRLHSPYGNGRHLQRLHSRLQRARLCGFIQDVRIHLHSQREPELLLQRRLHSPCGNDGHLQHIHARLQRARLRGHIQDVRIHLHSQREPELLHQYRLHSPRGNGGDLQHIHARLQRARLQHRAHFVQRLVREPSVGCQ